MLKRFLIPLILIPTAAFAWIHGVQATVVSESFGAITPTGYGGTKFGLAGPLTITSQSGACSPSLAGGGGSFIVDGNGNVVPNKSTGGYGGAGNNTWPDNTSYGGVSAIAGLGGSSCTLSLNNNGASVTATVSIQSNVVTVTPKPGATYNADGVSNFELANVLEFTGSKNLALGDTVVCRDGYYNVTAPSRYFLTWPSVSATPGNTSPWSGSSGRLVVTSEHQYTSQTDANGNLLQGGGCNLGYMYATSATADATIPLDFDYVNIYENTAGTVSASPAAMFTVASKAIHFNNVNVTCGPSVTNCSSVFGIEYLYGGTDTSAASNISITNSYFNNEGTEILVGVATGGTYNPPATITGNTLLNPIGRYIQMAYAAPSLISSNFFYGIYGVGGLHPDMILGQGSTTGYNGPGPTIDYNVFIHGPAGLVAAATVNFVSASGAAISNGTYTSLPSSPVSGGGNNAYLDLTVSGCPSSCSYSAVVTNETSGNGGGRGYTVGSQMSVTEGTLTVVFSVASLGYSPDAVGIFFAGSSNTDTITCLNIHNNIIQNTAGQGIALQPVGSCSTINYNDLLADFVSAPTNLFQSSLYQQNAGGVGGSWDRNVVNNVDISGQSGSPTCYPGTPTTCTAMTTTLSGSSPTWSGTLAKYQAIIPGWTTVWSKFNRANVLASEVPALTGTGKNADGTYSTAETPKDVNGQACWNNGLNNFNPALSCAAQGLTVAQ